MSYFGNVNLTDEYGWTSENTPMADQRMIQPFRLVGTSFSGLTALDPNFWSGSLYNTASLVVAHNKVTLSCSLTVANSSASMQSVRVARYVGAYANRFRSQVQLGDNGVQNNLRSWGMYNTTDGVFWELSGTTFNICTMKGGVVSRTGSANWNKSTTIPALNTCNTYEIYVTNKTAYFSLNDVLVHQYSALSDTYSDTLNLPIRCETKNFNGALATGSIDIRIATIARLGPEETQTQRGRVTVAGQYIFKYNSGRLDMVTLNTVPSAGGTVAIYDDVNGNTAANLIALITAPSAGGSTTNMVPCTLQYSLPFANGLTVVVTGTFDASIIYE
jgi:hypothetical protein